MDRPWETEPNRCEWQSANGYKCLVRRASMTGVLCGYVALPEGHPWRKLDPWDIPAIAHRGLTWNGPLDGDDHWLGFHCGHAFDYQPGLAARCLEHGSDPFAGFPYRDLPYVQKEVEELAAQAKLAGDGCSFPLTLAEA